MSARVDFVVRGVAMWSRYKNDLEARLAQEKRFVG